MLKLAVFSRHAVSASPDFGLINRAARLAPIAGPQGPALLFQPATESLYDRILNRLAA